MILDDNQPTQSAYDRLLERLRYISDVNSAGFVLEWDAQTVMPPAGAEARGRQLGILSRLRHETLTSPDTLKAIEAAELDVYADTEHSPCVVERAHMLRLSRRDYERAVKLPADFVAEFSRATSVAQHAWARARANNDFSAFRPYLEQIVGLVQRAAKYHGHGGEPYDAVLQEFEPSLSTGQVREIFADLKSKLVPLLRHVVANKNAVDDSCLQQEFSTDTQAAFCQKLVRALGLDPARSRLDLTAHPCTANISSPYDVRISTRYQPTNLGAAVFGVIHECGHAIYELGLTEKFAGTPLGSSASMSIHESQSRLMENFVGRSHKFWQQFYPLLQESFPQELGNVPLASFYRAINKAGPSFVRTESDELTYNLHIILRFELEQDLIAGRLSVSELPVEWKNRFEAMFGIRPPSDTLGVLQDVHWSAGLFGYFPSYALGNLFAAQLGEQISCEHPELFQEVSEGKFDTLREWLRENIHQHGRKYSLNELCRLVTKSDLTTDAFVRYLDSKFGNELYPGFERERRGLFII